MKSLTARAAISVCVSVLLLVGAAMAADTVSIVVRTAEDAPVIGAQVELLLADGPIQTTTNTEGLATIDLAENQVFRIRVDGKPIDGLFSSADSPVELTMVEE